MSPKQKRTAAIARRFQPWYLTDGMTSQALHISASFRELRELATLRARWPFLTREDRSWWLTFRVPDAIRSSRFTLSLYPNRLPC